MLVLPFKSFVWVKSILHRADILFFTPSLCVCVCVCERGLDESDLKEEGGG